MFDDVEIVYIINGVEYPDLEEGRDLRHSASRRVAGEIKMDIKFTFEDGSEAYLQHHGVKGMKWGVWNSETQSKYKGGDASWKGAKKTARQLNALDKRRAIEVGKAINANARVSKTQAKITRAEKRGANQEKIAKLENRLAGQRQQEAQHSRAAEGISKHQKKLSRQLVSQGYTVKTRDVRRSTLTKGEKAAQVMLNVAAAAAGARIMYAYDRTVSGTKYNVKKPV